MTQDTRKDRRVKIVSLNVRYKSATVDEFIENHAHDVSRGGIFIKTANPFPPGTLLKFEIRLASDQAVIAGVGRIVWKRDAGASSGDRPAGMGVKFIKLDEPSKVVIDRLVNTRPDAGKAFEIEDPAKAPSDRPVPRVSPSVRPATQTYGSSAPPTAKVPGARSMSPAGGVATATRGATMMTGAAGSPRKATMIGVGVTPVPPAPSSAPALHGATAATSTVPPAKPSFPAAPSAPPRPGTATPMFPKASPEKDWSTKQEPTVMKQAAELLEEALREAGGSMDEIGTNPLFSGSGGASARGTADHAKGPLASASEWTTADGPPPSNDVPAARDVVPAAATHEKPISHPAPDLRRARETPTSVRPASAARASDQAAAAKKGGSGTLVFFLLAAAALAAGAVKFRDQLFGASAPAEPVATPPTTEMAPAPSAVTTPSAVQAASASATAAAMTSAPSSSAAVAPPSSGAAVDGVPSTQKSAQAPVAPSPPPRPYRPPPKPVAPAAAAPAEPSATPTPSAETAPSAAPSTSAPPAKAASPPPKPKAGKPSSDDNPY